MTLITALVIDDHPLVARGIATFLQSHCGFDHVHAITNVEDLWSYIDSNPAPSIIVLDFWLSAGPSLTLLSQIRMKCLTTPIMVVSADDDIAVQNKVRAAGAQGFIHKQEAPDIFAGAVASLLNGKTWFVDTNQRRKPANQLNELTITAAELGLTARQGEILTMIMKGLPNKRIAQILSLSEQTVKEHVTGILGKLEVSNRIQAITKLRGKRLE